MNVIERLQQLVENTQTQIQQHQAQIEILSNEIGALTNSPKIEAAIQHEENIINQLNAYLTMLDGILSLFGAKPQPVAPVAQEATPRQDAHEEAAQEEA